MKRLYNVTIAASLLTGVWLAGAQAGEPPKDANCPPPGPGGPHGWGPPGMMGGPGGPGMRPRLPFADADADKDGRITHAEIDRAIKARFDAADADHNGALDAKEFDAARPKPPPDMPKPPEGAPPCGPHRRFDGEPGDRFKRLDWNGDGKLSLEEYAVPLRMMATHADHDGDGTISEDELKAPPGPPGPPPPR